MLITFSTFALLRINNENLAKDLVQDTFLAALAEASDILNGKSSERTWLTAILKNKIFDIYRQKSFRAEYHVNVKDAELEQD